MNPLDSDPFSMQMTSTEERKTAVFWDYELCPPPDGISGAAFVRKVRDLARVYSRSIFSFKAYFSSPLDEKLRSELRDSNVLVLEDKGGTVDKMRRTVDMLGFAMDQPPSVPGAVIFISSDADFVCVLSALRNKGHSVGLLCPPGSADAALEDHASDVFRWNEVLGLCGDPGIQNESLIDFEVDATAPPASQSDWARPPPSPQTILSSSTFADLRTVQPAILNDDPPRQDSGPNSPAHTRGEVTGSQSNAPPPAPNGQPLDSISIYADLITALEKENQTGVQEHIHSKIADRIRESNPDFLTNAKKGKFKKYLEAASVAGIVTNRYPNGEGW
ncbi:hypothetical protein FRC01_004153, partial [Tulasnella sp. 417]